MFRKSAKLLSSTERLTLETREVLVDLYDQLDGKEEISIGAPLYDRTQIDILVDNKLIQIIDASSLEGCLLC